MNSVRAQAFGLIWDSDIALDRFSAFGDSTTVADVVVRRASSLRPRDAHIEKQMGFICSDGARVRWLDEVTFDIYDGNRIDYLPGPGWRGFLPIAFYSTIAAFVSAMRGALPFHGCTVAVDGKALLICGVGGAGKSTLAAAMVAQGADFIADDLSIVTWDDERSCFVVQPGRPTVRLYPETAAWLDSAPRRVDPEDPRGKYMVTLASADRHIAVPLYEMIMLDDQYEEGHAIFRYAKLTRLLFRPNWVAQLPCRDARAKMLIRVANEIILRPLPRRVVSNESTFRAWGQSQIDRIASALDCCNVA